MKIKNSVIIGFITLLFALSVSAYQSQPDESLVELSITDFTDGERSGFVITDAGLTMEMGVNTAVYTSPEIETAIPFNAIVPNWQSNLPHNDDIGFMVRTRPHNGVWSDWQIVETHADWNDEWEPTAYGGIIFTPNAEQLHTHLQYSVSLGRHNNFSSLAINQVGFTLINSTVGPTTEEMITQQAALDETNTQRSEGSNPRPTVISREVWCTDPACDYTDGLEYVPASHLIVHHTVSANNGTDYNWAAVMRAIWNFHANTRGWGDIGYNYLIDINGVIYEGHMNEDYENLDVVGTHASGANSGSMAVSLIGNFIEGEGGIAPSQPMLNSLVNIMSWKADQRNINVYDAGNELPNINWGLPYLMGHRDVYGTTQCPGEQMHILLPWLRDQVATRIGLVDPYLYVQELDPEFTKSNANWYTPTYNCGHNLHAYYTWSTDDAASSSNWGEWEISVPENGRYRIDAHIPYCSTGRAETDGATYIINHTNGSNQLVFSHNDNVGLWMNLGEFEFDTTGNNSVYLSDLTTTDAGLGVWFDSLRLIRVEDIPEPTQTINNTSPINGFVTDATSLDFAWAISATFPISQTTFQISPNNAFTTTLHEESWQTAVTSTAQIISNEGSYYWRAQATLNLGNGMTETISSQPTSFTIERSDSNIENQTPTASYLTDQPTIDFSWAISNSYPVLSTTFQLSPDNTFTTTVHETSWNGMVTTTTHTLLDEGNYFWRVQTILDLGNNVTETISSEPTSFTFERPDSSINNLLPDDGFLTNQPDIDFGWSISNSYPVLSTTFQIGSDGTFVSPVHATSWHGAVTTTSHTLNQDGTFFWRAQTILDLGNSITETIASDASTFIVDTAVPTSTLTIYQIPDGDYPIMWSGTDATSGIASYNLFYRQQGELEWTSWFTETTKTDALFSPPNPAAIYEFTIQATDIAGNQQPLPTVPSTSTEQAILLSHAIMLPIVTRH